MQFTAAAAARHLTATVDAWSRLHSPIPPVHGGPRRARGRPCATRASARFRQTDDPAALAAATLCALDEYACAPVNRGEYGAPVDANLTSFRLLPVHAPSASPLLAVRLTNSRKALPALQCTDRQRSRGVPRALRLLALEGPAGNPEARGVCRELPHRRGNPDEGAARSVPSIYDHRDTPTCHHGRGAAVIDEACRQSSRGTGVDQKRSAARRHGMSCFPRRADCTRAGAGGVPRRAPRTSFHRCTRQPLRCSTATPPLAIPPQSKR
jgi:hypothetical protein